MIRVVTILTQFLYSLSSCFFTQKLVERGFCQISQMKSKALIQVFSKVFVVFNNEMKEKPSFVQTFIVHFKHMVVQFGVCCSLHLVLHFSDNCSE